MKVSFCLKRGNTKERGCYSIKFFSVQPYLTLSDELVLIFPFFASVDQSVHSLCAVDFSLNVADDIAAEIVNLPQLKNLKSLLLKKCRISPNSIADLSKLVAVTTPEVPLISSLTLDGIKLSGTDALKRMLGLSDMFIPITPCSFELLSLIGCGLNDRDVKPLMTAIGNGLIIKELRLAANRLTDTSVNNLLESTGNSLSLETLDLSINKVCMYL